MAFLSLGDMRGGGGGSGGREVGLGDGALPRLGGRPVNGPGDPGGRIGSIFKVCCMNVRGCNEERE